ncbi:PIN domain nuclease [Streptomyces triticagri]|uniref:Ribonuclease VapC n=1 Tax=Streptomyces triticagri TaxID=2293568 RepID=A0A372LWP0_9ACTN|nr:PIN domain nuclease [Streptomyces triticagri]RFU82959.1 PIN domain nuclease [Streptomyces triticagri]
MTQPQVYLVDKSAHARWGKPAVAERLDVLSERGLIAVCGMVEMELLVSARSARQAQTILHLVRGFDLLPTPDEVWDRAKEVQIKSINRGFHRTLKLPDLVIAATAERHGAIVLHYDQDYDRISSITGQKTEWVVERGTAD